MLLNLTLPMDDRGLDMDEGDEEVQPSPRKLSFTKKMSSMELIVTTPPSPPPLEPVLERPQLTKKLSSQELLIQEVKKHGGSGKLKPLGEDHLLKRRSSSGSAHLGRVLGAEEAKFKIEALAEEERHEAERAAALAALKQRLSDLEVLCQTSLRESGRESGWAADDDDALSDTSGRDSMASARTSGEGSARTSGGGRRGSRSRRGELAITRAAPSVSRVEEEEGVL